MTVAQAKSTTNASVPATTNTGHRLPEEILRREVNVLVVDGDSQTSQLVEACLRPLVRKVDHARDLTETLQQLRHSPYHVILADLEGANGEQRRLELCRYLSENRPDTAVVVISDEERMQTAIAAMRAGAFDLVTKPLQRGAIEHAVQRAASQALLERRLHRLADEDSDLDADKIIGASTPVRTMLDRISRVADTDVTILITGESGTGKELVARAMHDNSARAKAPFVAVNCAAIPSELLEAELFGHVKGAFTDAKKAKEGLFVRAEGGTLFLDEVGEMPAGMQVKLLRALQERKVRPVGATTETTFNVRLLAATNLDLEAEVKASRFREDLFYRLNVVRIQTPPLRERGDDVLTLAQHFVNRWAKRMNKRVLSISGEAARHLMEHAWPGNVRELENVMQRAVALSQYDEIVPSDLGSLGSTPSTAPQPRPAPTRSIAAPTPAPVHEAASSQPVPAPVQAAMPPGAATPAPGMPEPMRTGPNVPGMLVGEAQPQAASPSLHPSAPQPARAAPAPERLEASRLEFGPGHAQPARTRGHLPLRRTHGTEVDDRPMVDRIQTLVRNSLSRLDLDGDDEIPTLDRLETMYILEMLRACDGNKTKASSMLGMARRTLYRRLKQMDLDETPGTARVAERSPASQPEAGVAEDVI